MPKGDFSAAHVNDDHPSALVPQNLLYACRDRWRHAYRVSWVRNLNVNCSAGAGNGYYLHLTYAAVPVRQRLQTPYI